MRERVRILGGTIDIADSHGRFTIDAVIPLSSQQRGVPTPVVDGHAAADMDAVAGSVRVHRRTHRRRVAVAAILPVSMTLIVAGALFATNAITVARSGMDPATFERLRIGQQRSALDRILPVAHITTAPPTFAEPRRPTGAMCEFFRPTTNPFVMGADSLFRLCFVDHALVSKDVVS
jgi:hypothetical protein